MEGETLKIFVCEEFTTEKEEHFWPEMDISKYPFSTIEFTITPGYEFKIYSPRSPSNRAGSTAAYFADGC